MRTIELSNTKDFVAVVSDKDYARVSAHEWRAAKRNENYYAVKCGRVEQREVFMQNFILPPPKGFIIDHRDGNGLVNTRRNLRVCTRAQNNAAFRRKAKNKSSQFRGVSFDKRLKKWTAQSWIDGRKKHLGMFFNEEDAARAYDKKALELYGEFASLNFPQEIK